MPIVSHRKWYSIKENCVARTPLTHRVYTDLASRRTRRADGLLGLRLKIYQLIRE